MTRWKPYAMRPRPRRGKAPRELASAGLDGGVREVFVPLRPTVDNDVSLLIGEGQPITEVARQAGHSPTTCLELYASVFDEYDPTERVPAEVRIRRARESGVSAKCPVVSDAR